MSTWPAPDAHKWLLGPHGIGVAAVSPRAREQLRPQQPGWASVPYREEWDNLELHFDETARRYEGGSPNVITTVGMGASIDLLLDAGVEAVWHHVDGLCQRLASGLTDLGAELRSVHDSENRSAIVSFTLPNRETDSLVEALEAKGILVRARGGAVRLAPHGYNTADEIDITLAAIAKLA